MKKLLFCLIVLLIYAGCSDNDELNIKQAKGFPRWIKAGEKFTQQTSGITFIKTDQQNIKHFLLADDVGKLHRLSVKNDTIFTLNSIGLSESLTAFLSTLPKADIEEILYDKYTGNVFITIEGHKPKLDAAGVYKVIFYNNDLFSDSVLAFEKLKISPENELFKYIDDNVGYEGLAMDEKYIYLGLEGFRSESIFADSTLLFVISREDLKILKMINTKEAGIHTICGLYAREERNILGVDRNNKKIFQIILDDNLEIVKFNLTDLFSYIPDYPDLQYTASLEGLTMDNEKNLYLVDDPWENFFIPSKDVLDKTDEQTINNFRNYIPVIFKYKIQ